MAHAASGPNLRIDIALAATATAIALWAAWMLVADIPLFVREQGNTAVRPIAGLVVTFEHGLRRRSADVLLWDQAGIGDELRVLDQLFTDQNATAVVTLADGTRLELGENTLIALEMAEDKPILSVIRGTIRAQTLAGAVPVAIRVAGRKTLLKAAAKSDVSVRIEIGKIPEVTVAAGSVVVDDQIVHVRQTATLTNDGTTVIDTPISTPISTTISVPAAMPAESTVLPSNSPTTQPVPAPRQPPKAPMLPKRLEILLPLETKRAPGLQLLLDLFESTAYAAEASLVRWEAVPNADGYDVEVARDEAFIEVVIKKTVSLPEVDVAALMPGTYFLRVATRSAEGGISAPSEAMTMVIGKRDEKTPALAAPVLVAPVDGVDMKLAGGSSVVTFAWESVPKAAAYVLQVLSADGSILFEKRTRGQDANAELRAGAYSWRVGALRKRDEDAGAWSKSWRFSVTHIVAPALITKTKDEPIPSVPPASLHEIIWPIVGLRLAHAPSSYRYEASNAGTSTRLHATLLNSFNANAVVWATSNIGIGIEIERIATKVFDTDEDDIPTNQKSLPLRSLTTSGDMRLRLFGDPTAYFDARLGYQGKGITLFQLEADGTMSAKQAQARGLAIGGSAGVTFSHFTLRSQFNYAHINSNFSSDIDSGKLLDIDGSIAWPCLTSHVEIMLGLKAAQAHVDAVTIRTQSILWGFTFAQ